VSRVPRSTASTASRLKQSSKLKDTKEITASRLAPGLDGGSGPQVPQGKHLNAAFINMCMDHSIIRYH
jgi:hypothetical protein